MPDLDSFFDSVRQFALRAWGETPVSVRITLPSGKAVDLPVPGRGGAWAAGGEVPVSIPEAVGESGGEPGDCAHSRTFRVVIWGGKRFQFTATQRHVIAVLWEAWHERTVREVEEEELLEAASCESARLHDIFKDSPSWGTLVVRTSEKMYSLADPETFWERPRLPG